MHKKSTGIFPYLLSRVTPKMVSVVWSCPMKNVKTFLLTLSALALLSCSGSGTSSKRDSRIPVSEDAYYAAVKAAPEASYTAARLTAFYDSTQNGEKYIDEKDMTCTYAYDPSHGEWAVEANNLGTYTSTFLDAPNQIEAIHTTLIFQSFETQLGLQSSAISCYVESNSFEAKLTGNFPASKLDSEIEGTLSFTLNLAFNPYGLITSYDCVNTGTFTMEGHRLDYTDHSGFSVSYMS